jgi:hypothetical protein
MTKTDRAEAEARRQQRRALRLKPWELPPCEVDEEPDGDPTEIGLLRAWELRQRLIAAGLSVYEPDPIGALAAIEARQAGAQMSSASTCLPRL